MRTRNQSTQGELGRDRTGHGRRRSGGARLGLFAAAAAAGLALFASSCSLIVDTNANQCTVDADCVAQFHGGTCTKDGICAGLTGECKVNADCKTKGAHVICRKDTLKCVSLTSPDCTTIHGDDANDNAFIIGSILPTTGPDS